MESHGQINGSSSSAAGDELDLTLRLGLPFYDNEIQKMKNVFQASSVSNKDILQISNGVNSAGFNFNNFLSLSSPASVAFVPPYEIVESSVPPRITIPRTNGLVLARGQKKSVKKCKDCTNDQTPLWRRGPEGPQTLCNACGIRYARSKRAGAQ